MKLILAVLLGMAIPVIGQLVEKKPRMQYQGTETVDAPEGNRYRFDFIHDTETGQEVVCVHGYAHYPSCYLTGRKW